jgi:FMN phosphatase YigB (HAD superfamily)
MKYVYLDMDGVLCDFHKKYQLLFDITAQEAKAANRKKYRELWDDFLDMQAFTTLDWYPGGEELIEYMRTLDPKKVQNQWH